MEEAAGFEPAELLHSPVFETGAISLSATLPYHSEEGAGFEPAGL